MLTYMYLRETRQRRVDGSYLAHLQIAESVWDPVKRHTKIRILYNSGRADDLGVAERLRRLARSILRRCSPEDIVSENPQWQLLDAWPYGDIYVLEHLWQRLGMAEVLREVLDRRKLDFPLERALFAMVAQRAVPLRLNWPATNSGWPRRCISRAPRGWRCITSIARWAYKSVLSD